MARQPIKCGLSVSSIQSAIKELEAYRDGLQEKCDTFVGRLINEYGIETAKHNVGNYGKYISFTMKTDPIKDGCKAVMVATNTGMIHSEWRTKEGVKSADVNPLLMVEFGSGLRAKNPLGVPGVGTGTFPGGTHGADPSGWWWMDLDEAWHHSYGQSPLAPMYKASLQMSLVTNVEKVAREVFGDS